MAALRYFHDDLGDKIWGRFGFIDGFSEQHDWYADSYLAISQGPIVVMIENYRSGLIWKLFMGIPEIREGMTEARLQQSAFRFAGIVTALDDWIEKRSARRRERDAARRFRYSDSSRIVPTSGSALSPRPGSVLASPVLAAYDPDPDYFFHWFRDSAIVIDALRTAREDGRVDATAVDRLREFVEFSQSVRGLDGREFIRDGAVPGQVRAVLSAICAAQRGDRGGLRRRGAGGSARQSGRNARLHPLGAPAERWAGARGSRAHALARGRARPRGDPSERPCSSSSIGDLDFVLSRARAPSFDIWEEERGYHYFTQLVQAEALARGAEWLEEAGEAARARACRAAADALAPSLDAYWSTADGFYRSRMSVTGGGSPQKALDIAVILGVLHAGRAKGRA